MKNAKITICGTLAVTNKPVFMNFSSEEIKTYLEIAKPFVEPVIDTILKPQLEKLSGWLKKRSVEHKVIDNYFEDKFTQYLSQTHRNSSIINTLVFPNQQIKIKDVYCPLTVISTKNQKKYKITEDLNSDFLENKRLLISDTGGMGKSTLMKWITLSLIENPSTIPILVELRKLNNSNKILDEIFDLIDPIDKSFDKELIIKFLELGFFTIILDGFDEIPKDIQETITSELREFINKVPDNNFILTSRPESALSSFGDFQMFNIKPLEPKESFEVIKKYDSLNDIKYAPKLIEEIKTRMDQVKEFLTNPFLISLLYKTYTYNKDIPSKKTTFYEEVYSALFKHHDSSKDGYKRPKISKLDILDFRIILRHIAFETAKLKKVIYTELELLTFISNSKSKSLTINFKESEYLEDLLLTVPLFARDGAQIKWAHKSVQDYFAAEYITLHIKKEEMLRRIYLSEKDNYWNIIDFTYELEPKLFRKVILYPLLKEFVHHIENSYSNCSKIKNADLHLRRARTFGILFGIVVFDEMMSFDDAEELFKKAVDIENNEISSMTRLSENIFVISSRNFKIEILDILAYKRENLFDESWSVVNSFKNIKKLEKNVAHIVDENPDSPLNSEKTFKETTNLIKRHSVTHRHTNVVLNFEKAKAMIKLLEKEIVLDESDEDLRDI